MTKTRTMAITTCVLTLALCAPVSARALQAPEQVDDGPTAPIPAAELEIAYYTPTGVSIQTLLPLAEELFGAEVLVERPTVPGRDGGEEWVMHFLQVQGTILIRDTAEQVLRIRNELERVEQSLGVQARAAPPATHVLSDAQLVDWQYEPRYVAAKTLHRALSRFHRTFYVLPPDGMQGEALQAHTITSLEDRNMLLVHDTPEQIEKIKAFIAGIDQPVPQVTITYYVVTGHTGADVQRNGRAIPDELVTNLKRLVPADVYQLELTGVLRSSVSGRMTVEDHLRQMDLRLEPASFNPQGGTLNLATCSFEYQKRSFGTSATLREGEYTVLGAAGETPVFLVLRLTVG